MARAFLSIIRASIKECYVYRASALILLFSTALQVFLQVTFWTALQRSGSITANGLSPSQLVTYAALGVIQLRVLTSNVHWHVQWRVSTGDVAVDLVRPRSFVSLLFARDIGRFIFNIAIAAIVLGVTMWLMSVEPPASWVNGLAYVVSVSLALVVNFLVMVSMAALSFWLVETSGVYAVLYLMVGLLSGGVIPLNIMPEPLRRLCEVLPFQAAIHIPVSVYIGHLDVRHLATSIAVQLLWIAVLAALAAFVWSRVQRKLIIQGG